MLNKFSNVFKSRSSDIKDKLKDYIGTSLTTTTSLVKKESAKYEAQIAKIDSDILEARKLMDVKTKELSVAVDEADKIRIRGEIDALKATSSRNVVEETRRMHQRKCRIKGVLCIPVKKSTPSPCQCKYIAVSSNK